MSFQTELDARLQYKLNYVVKIGSEWFSKHQVDSDTGDIIGTGSGIPSSNVGLVDSVTANGTAIDLTRIKSVIDSTTIKIVEDETDQTFTKFMGANDNTLQNEDVEIYLGIIDISGGTFDFASYQKVNDYLINGISLSNSTYSIRATSRTHRFKVGIFDVSKELKTSISNTDTTLTVSNTENDVYPDEGFLKIEDEYMEYTSGNKSHNPTTDETTFSSLTRGSLGSTAASHAAGLAVSEYTELEDNPITILLQLLLSGSGASGAGAPYDVLHDGFAVDESLVDIAGMESIRTDFFSTDTFRLYIGEITDGLAWVESHLLLPNNIRFVEKDGKIGISALDQTVVGASLPVLDKDVIEGTPSWEVDANRIYNEVDVKWNWSEGLQQFSRLTTLEDTDSKAIFGTRKGPTLEFRGVQADLSGSTIVSDRGNRFLARFSTPQVRIKATCFLKEIDLNPGDKVTFDHPDLPQSGGGRGINTELEIVSKKVNWNNGKVEFALVYTSYFNLRRAVIAPSPDIASVTSQTVFDVTAGQGANLDSGYFVRLWNTSTNSFESDPVNEIDSVSGDTVTMVTAWTTTLNSSIHRLRFANYDEQSSDQIARYASISPASDFFADGSKAYQIQTG